MTAPGFESRLACLKCRSFDSVAAATSLWMTA